MFQNHDFITLLLLILLFIILFKIFSNNYSNNQINYFTDQRVESSTLPTKIINGQPVVHLLWTGGYDSTSRLCELIIKYKKFVQPIYVMAPNTDGVSTGLLKTRRKNIDRELISMQKIKRMLYQQFPYSQHLILKTVFVTKCKYDDEVKKCMTVLHQAGKFTRNVTQYGAFATISRYYNLRLEVCTIKDPGEILSNTVKNDIVPVYHNTPNWILRDDCPQELNIFKLILFPTIHKTKQNLLIESRYYRYENILAETVSCWYPVLKFGKYFPCGKCQMCKERIIKEK